MASANIHASCVTLAKGAPFPVDAAPMGVLLLGDSGVGKSDLALRLIAEGGILVSDDRTELFVADGTLRARAPATLAGLIELRGIGIISMDHETAAAVDLVVQLIAGDVLSRLPEPERYAPPAPLALPQAARPPLIRLNAFTASATARLRWAAHAFRHGLFRDDGNAL